MASVTPRPDATPNKKPNRNPHGRTSEVQPKMAERAIPVPAIAERADPSEIFFCASISISLYSIPKWKNKLSVR